MSIIWLACIFTSFVGVIGQIEIDGLPNDRPLIVAHRGSSGMRPEHTVAAYQLAIEQGADIIECDVAVTKDLDLICSHEPWINDTTNVASFPEFEDRIRTYTILGVSRTDYYTIDFTMEELKRLRKVQSRSYRDQSYNGLFPMASFDDYIAVAQNASNGRTVGIYPETKLPSFFNFHLRNNDTTMEDLLLDSLTRHGYTQKSSPCFVQSFSEASLRYMSNRTELLLVFLTELALRDDKLSELSSFCYGLGPSKTTIVAVDSNRKITEITDYIQRAHRYGLKVHPYTFRNEDQFLAYDYGSDPYREYETFFDAEVDGLFTDFPWSLASYIDVRNGGWSLASSNMFYFFSVISVMMSL